MARLLNLLLPAAVLLLALLALRSLRRRRGCATLLEVDGGINAETGPLCVRAGADWLVAGNSLFGAKDPAAVVRALHGLA